MARKLTKKQRDFVNAYADTGVGSIAVKKAKYEVSTDESARAIASQNLTKPPIVEELRKLGFDSNNAKRVVAEILNGDEEESRDRLKAAEQVFKVNSDYAPEKRVTLNVTPIYGGQSVRTIQGYDSDKEDIPTVEED